MDRQIVHPGQILPETTLLQMAKDAMIGSSKLAAAMLGTSTIANGFAVTPTGPASLQVVVAPGEIYSLANIDSLAFSTLPADTTHSILKQGIMLDGVTLSCPAPTTTGQSINYLIQVTYQDQDSTPVLLPYYNSANPALPYSGMGNNGLTQNTSRKGAAIVQVKAGASAATGSQSTPAPDSGYIGLYVATVSFGQTTITSVNIAQYSAAPLLPSGLIQSVQSGNVSFAIDSGAANVYSCSFSPAITARVEGQTLRFKVNTANTGASTFNDGLGAVALLGGAHSALQGGELVANGDAWVQWNSSVGTGAGSYILLFCTGAAEQVANGTKSRHAVALGQTPTETLGGAPLVATQAMVTAGLDDTAYVTAKKLASWFSATFAQATELVAGIGKLATSVMARAGTDDASFMTALKTRQAFQVFGLGTTNLPINNDLDSIFVTGITSFNTTTSGNPGFNFGTLNTDARDPSGVIQVAKSAALDIMAMRHWVTSAWSPWVTFAITASPALTGTPTAPTAAATTATTQIATTAFVNSLFSKRVFGTSDFIRVPDVSGGLIIQWAQGVNATVAAGATATQTIAFPTPFPNGVLKIMPSTQFVSGAATTTLLSPGASSLTQASVSVQNPTTSGPGTGLPLIIAIGY